MPLINHIRGEQVPDAMLTVRTPIVRIPWWLTIPWWTLRGLFRVVVSYLRFWYVTVPVTLLVWLFVEYGWIGPVLAVTIPTGALIGWWLAHRASFRRFAGRPVLGRWRRFTYRRDWHPAMATAGLAVSFDGLTVLPVMRKVRCNTVGDVVTVRMVTGQIPDDYSKVSERLAHTFAARACSVTPGGVRNWSC